MDPGYPGFFGDGFIGETNIDVISILRFPDLSGRESFELSLFHPSVFTISRLYLLYKIPFFLRGETPRLHGDTHYHILYP